MPTFLNPDGSFFNETSGGPVLLAQNPASASTIKMRAVDRVLFVNAGLMGSLSVWLPPGVEPGENVDLCFETGVTTLAVNDSDGVLVPSAPTTNSGPGAAITMKYVGKEYGWFFWAGGSTGSGPTGSVTLDGTTITLDGTPVDSLA